MCDKTYMKILILSHLFPRPNQVHYGTFIYKLSKAISNLGVEVKVVSPVPLSPFPLNKLSEKWNRYKNIPAKFFFNEIEVFYPRYVIFPKKLFHSSSGVRMYKGIADSVE